MSESTLAEFTGQTIFVREVVNGSITIAGIFMIAVFGHYIWKNWEYRKKNNGVAIKASIAILVLTVGHVLRASYSWATFLAADLNWDVNKWLAQGSALFLISAALVLAGKALMLFNFSPWDHRKAITVWAVATAIIIPAVLAIIL